ncbi:BH3-interacting domain death agonist isoform X3 [Canis lupus baileyi]|uniref:BH3-interacting domain death agonist n=2 Tax=Canis lupus familiaris TaxID=9615 RepID=A0A8P0SKH5_CANLF|nr:BH3-interacting domain death agonist isoform X2 [Canis lupus dingo]XP_038295466.1 BH3-interacting domain death agonist isoform X3 [Canis lupus familiaris]XP_038315492.1 BH3-interacting domain death agonist isoform X3 [Canis lupus familiaris]XP_038432175.1 BH3-interacting domain death agonist isoform X3 [Canis lupus familiaris]
MLRREQPGPLTWDVHRARSKSEPCKAAHAMESKVSNGSGPQDERITNLLVFGFLQNCSNYNFHEELELLGRELPVPAYLKEDYDDELQTDGNRCSYFLDGGARDSESQEEIIQDIARQLAQIGDRMDHSIHPGLVNNLAMQFMNVNLSEEDRRKHLAAALEQAMQTYPKDMEKEKTMLMLAMLLAKKVADHTPSLLRDVFHTTVNFISQNLLTYVRNLVRNEMD